MHRIVSSIGVEVPRHLPGIGRIALKDVSEMVRIDIQEAKSARHTTAHHDRMSGNTFYHTANQLCSYASFDSSAHVLRQIAGGNECAIMQKSRKSTPSVLALRGLNNLPDGTSGWHQAHVWRIHVHFLFRLQLDGGKACALLLLHKHQGGFLMLQTCKCLSETEFKLYHAPVYQSCAFWGELHICVS